MEDPGLPSVLAVIQQFATNARVIVNELVQQLARRETCGGMAGWNGV
jgi:hypothetical protein